MNPIELPKPPESGVVTAIKISERLTKTIRKIQYQTFAIWMTGQANVIQDGRNNSNVWWNRKRNTRLPKFQEVILYSEIGSF